MTPSFEPQFLSCSCGHQWIGHLPVHVPIPVWSAHVKAMCCPDCGGGPKKIRFGQKPKDTPVDTTKPIELRVHEWRSEADTGRSSIAIAVMLTTGKYGNVTEHHPHDPEDLGRCLRLLRIIPEWRDRIGEMAACGPVWAALSARWDDLERSMTDETGLFGEKAKAALKTYALMRGIIEAGRR